MKSYQTKDWLLDSWFNWYEKIIFEFNWIANLVVLAGRLVPAAIVAADRGRFTRANCRFEAAFDNSVESERFEVSFGNRAESPRFEVSFGNRAELHISKRSLPAAFSKVQAEMKNVAFSKVQAEMKNFNLDLL